MAMGAWQWYGSGWWKEGRGKDRDREGSKEEMREGNGKREKLEFG